MAVSEVKPARIPDLQGGLNTADATIIPDNALAVATNVFYNKNKNLQTRYGKTTFGYPVPSASKQIHDCDTIAGNGNWAVTDDGVNLAADATVKKRAAASLSFDITVATSGNDDALLTNSTMTAVDISTVKGGIGFWMYVPSGFTTNLTNVKLRVGSGAANYYEFTFSSSSFTSSSTWLFLYDSFSNATTTGTPNDAAINYVQLRITYSAAYTNKTGIRIDDVVAYASTSTNAMMSLKYFKTDASTPVRYLHTNVGTCLYEYDDTSTRWTLVKSGLTSGTRFAMTPYKNIMYFTNGVDNYFSYTGTTATEHTGANTYKGKYLLLANDVGYILGDPSVPSTLAYTNATPANLQTFPNALVLDEDDSSGEGTGLTNMEGTVIAFKRGKIYKVNTATPSRTQLDYSNGALGGRAIIRVENEVFFANDGGIWTLAQRQNLVGSFRADPLTHDIEYLFDALSKLNLQNAAGFYASDLNNFYFWIDADGDGVNDTTLVYSLLTKAWTQYNNVAANEAVIYEDASGEKHFLIANPSSGQCYEIETGTSDNGNEINADIKGKAIDFNMPEYLKTVEAVDVFGFINDGGRIRWNILVDGVDSSGDVFMDSDNYVTATSGSFTLGASALASGPLAGSGSGSSTDTITFYPFKFRIPMYATGGNVQIRARNETLDSMFIWTKYSLYPTTQPIDVYPNDYIA